MSSTQTGMLVAAVGIENDTPVYDGIGRVFTTNSGSRFVRMDVWPVTPDWSYMALILPKNWKPNCEVPIVTADTPLQKLGKMSIVCESWKAGSGENAKPQHVPRIIGHYYTTNTKQGAVELCRFRSIPANPNWYTATKENPAGTISLYPDAASAASEAA